MTGLTLKERWSERLADHPLLRTMLLNPWFALALTGVVLLGLTAAVSLPKVWTTSPGDFRPIIKISLLDLLQARALESSARRKTAAGDHLGAALAWQSAVGNNPGNLELYRGALRHLGQAPELPMRVAGRTLAAANWLVRLGGTNRLDYEILAAAFDRYGLSEEVHTLLTPLADELSPDLQGAYLKALFAVGGYADFGARWAKMEGQLPDDPALALHHTAYLAGWGPIGGMEAKLQELKAAMDDARLGPLACRLIMAVSRKRMDPDLFAEGLQRQQERSQDRVTDHAQYWQLLVGVGRKEEARRLAETFARPPQSAYDVVVTAETLAALDLQDLCLSYLRRHAAEFGVGQSRWSVAVWAAYADLLIARRQWEDLKAIATEMRTLPGGHEVLNGFGRYLEGRVAYAQGAGFAARAAFEEAVAVGFPAGRVAIRVGEGLCQMGYPELALQALRNEEERFEQDLGYWRVMFDATYALREDEALLLKVASRAHALDPASVEWQFNYAAALLIGRWRVEEALGLTMQLLARHPASAGARINHAIALIYTGRVEEAEALLREVDADQLVAAQAAAYRFAFAGVHRAKEEWDRVREDLRALEGERLFPSQRRWLEQIRRAIPGPS